MAKSSPVTHTMWTLKVKYNFFPVRIIIQTDAGPYIFHFKWETLALPRSHGDH